MSDYFPREILVEILHRQTLKSLVKCTSVGKSWKSLITDPSFVSDHLNRFIKDNNGRQHLLLRLCREKTEENDDCNELFSLRLDNEQLDFLSRFEYPLAENFFRRCSQVVGTCNGLVCLSSCLRSYGYVFIIWNPSVRKYVVLPEPTVTFNSHGGYDACYGFGFDSKNNDFKLVRLVTLVDDEDCPPFVEVYSLATGCWKRMADKTPPFILQTMVFSGANTPNQMFMNGALHWVVMRRGSRSIVSFILSFDVAEETFEELTLPQSLSESKHLSSISVLPGGDLLVVSRSGMPFFSGQDFDIWVMKEYGVVESWTKVFSYKQLPGISGLKVTRPLGIRRKSGEVVLENHNGGILAVDPVTKLVKNLGIKGGGYAFLGYHVESLFLLNKKTNVISY